MTSLQPQPYLRPQLIAVGMADPAIRTLCRNGDWSTIKRGAYFGTRELDTMTKEERHRLMIEASRSVLDPGTVLSHASAAILHGLPAYRVELGAVHVTRNRGRSGHRGRNLHIHENPLAASEVVQVQGFATTSVARTVLDLACAPLFGTGVAIADAALHRKMVDQAELFAGVDELGPRHGISFARRSVAFADPRSESVGESLSRIAMFHCGLPTPDLQVEVRTADYQFEDRCDFEVTEFDSIGEFDGLIKYGRLRRPGETPGDAVVREKVREDRIRDAGKQVVRWTWAELFRFEVVEQRWLRAFERGRRASPGSV